MRVILAGVMLQAWHMRRSPDAWLPLAVAPLTSVTMLAIIVSGGRQDLAYLAIVGPGIMATFQLALFEASEFLVADRAKGVLEAQLATPAPLLIPIIGRTLVVVVLGSFAFIASAGVVAIIDSGLLPTVHYPIEAVAAIAIGAVCAATTALPLAALFLVTRAVRVVQNSLPWPFFLLGGVIVPVAALPAWLQPASGAVFLSWESRALQASFAPHANPDFPLLLGALVVLAALGTVAGAFAFAVAERSIRRGGEATRE